MALLQGPRLHRIYTCYHLLTATCAVCYALGRPITLDHTAEHCPDNFGNSADPAFKVFRSFCRQLRVQGCHGCSIPNSVSPSNPVLIVILTSLQIWYTNRTNVSRRLAHRGHQGLNCAYQETIHPLVYTVLNHPTLSTQFQQSTYNTDYLKFRTPEQTPLEWWLVRVSAENRPINNMLSLVEFIISLRGMPSPCRTLTLLWE